MMSYRKNLRWNWRLFFLGLAALLLLNAMGMSKMVQAETDIKNVLVVVDPGFSKFSLDIGQKIADQLRIKNLTVELETINQFKPQDLNGIDLLVLGGPTYIAQPSGRLKKFVSNLNPAVGLKILLYITGGSDCGGLAPLTGLVEAKGLQVYGSCGILCTPGAAPDVDEKINQLIANI